MVGKKDAAPVAPQKIDSLVPPEVATSYDDLFEDTALGDGIVSQAPTTIPHTKPHSFFRMHPDERYRRRTLIYTKKSEEGGSDDEHYIVSREMAAEIPEAQPCTLATVISRDGGVRLWILKLPKEGGRDNGYWETSRKIAAISLEHWVRLVAKGQGYEPRYAEQGYAPEPDWSRVPPFQTLIDLSFGPSGVIRDRNHPIYRELYGVAPKGSIPSDPLAADEY